MKSKIISMREHLENDCDIYVPKDVTESFYAKNKIYKRMQCVDCCASVPTIELYMDLSDRHVLCIRCASRRNKKPRAATRSGR